MWEKRGPTHSSGLPPARRADGDIVIADGHWPRPSDAQQDGDRLVWLDTTENSSRSARWAPGPGEFMGPHGLAFDSKGRLFVADQSNNRLQIFDPSMKFVDDWRLFGRPSGVAILKDDTLVVADSESSGPSAAHQLRRKAAAAVRNPGWQNGIASAAQRMGHCISSSRNTAGGVGADNGNHLWRTDGRVRSSKSGGCLQKFIKEYQR